MHATLHACPAFLRDPSLRFLREDLSQPVGLMQLNCRPDTANSVLQMVTHMTGVWQQLSDCMAATEAAMPKHETVPMGAPDAHRTLPPAATHLQPLVECYLQLCQACGVLPATPTWREPRETEDDAAHAVPAAAAVTGGGAVAGGAVVTGGAVVGEGRSAFTRAASEALDRRGSMVDAPDDALSTCAPSLSAPRSIYYQVCSFS